MYTLIEASLVDLTTANKKTLFLGRHFDAILVIKSQSLTEKSVQLLCLSFRALLLLMQEQHVP